MCGHCYQRIPQIRQQAEQARAKIAQSERVSVCGTDGVGWGGVGSIPCAIFADTCVFMANEVV